MMLKKLVSRLIDANRSLLFALNSDSLLACYSRIILASFKSPTSLLLIFYSAALTLDYKSKVKAKSILALASSMTFTLG